MFQPVSFPQRRFSTSLVISGAVHALILVWLWIHRPIILDVNLPGTLAVDLVGPESTAPPAAAPAPQKAVEAPPQPIRKDEVIIPTRRVKTPPKPVPPPKAQPRHTQAPPSPTPPSASQTSTASTTMARIGLSGAPGVTSDSKLGYYLIGLRNKIRDNWREPAVENRIKTTILFRIAKDGSLMDARVEVSSGNPDYDQLALRAIKAAAPFIPLPSSLDANELGVLFDFDSGD